MADSKIMPTFAADFEKSNKVDPLAQSVEHNTFNVGVLGSSPKRITEKRSFWGFSFFSVMSGVGDLLAYGMALRRSCWMMPLVAIILFPWVK